MPNKKLSVEEIKQIAEAAIGARTKANEAKKAAEDAGGADEALNAAVAEADKAAVDAESVAQALSQSPVVDPAKKVTKLLKKQRSISKALKELGVDEDEEDDEGDEDDEDDIGDDDKPVTFGDLKRINASKARKTALDMADAIPDAADKTAVVAALKRLVPSEDPEKDFKEAVAIANVERNSKVLEEVARKGITRTRPTGTGAAPLREEIVELTSEEKKWTRPPFNLSEKEIVAARSKV